MAQVLTSEQEQVSPGIKLVNEKSTTLDHILGYPNIQDPLELLKSSVDVKVYKSEDSVFYSVSFPTSYFSKERFISLLTRATSEQKPSLESLGILADWRMPDESGDYNEKLKTMHRSIGEPWFEFNREHRHRFMDALENYETERVLYFLEQQSKAFITKENAIEEIKDVIQQPNSKNKPHILTDNGLISSWYRFNTGNRLNKNKLKAMTGQHRVDVKTEAFQFPDKFLYTLLEHKALPQYNFFVDEINPDILFYERNPLSTSLSYSMESLGQGHFKVSYRGSWIEMGLEDGNFRKIDGNINFNYKALSPWIVWTKSLETGDRKYLTSGIPAEVSSEIDEHANSLLGLIAVAGLSPDERKRLPLKSTLDGSKRNQPMVEAQIPVLISMEPYRGNILNGSLFFRNTETLYTPGVMN